MFKVSDKKNEESKIEECEQELSKLNFKLQRTLKNLRYCRRECRDITQIIGEMPLDRDSK